MTDTTTYSADMKASMTHATNHTNRIDVEEMPLIGKVVLQKCLFNMLKVKRKIQNVYRKLPLGKTQLYCLETIHI